MAMSRDRVRFKVTYQMLTRDFSAYRLIIQKAFQYNIDTRHISTGIVFVCRPSQFARFMIYRYEMIKEREMKGANTFMEMEPELFELTKSDEVDVSKNARTF